MTTIAYDGYTLACDGKMTIGNKIIKLDDVKIYAEYDNSGRVRCFGMAGAAIADKILRDWAKDTNWDISKIHEFFPDEDASIADFTALVIIDYVAYYVYMGKVTVLGKHHKCSIGSGADFALSAMNLGKTAIEAVKHACEIDVYSGGKISAVKVRDYATRTRKRPKSS